jgi:predicted dithiol-disulfide oxidoreductase (DUF899 family)
MEQRFPNESDDYRKARNELLDAEAALREQTERVAALRRTLPVGGEAKEDYEFEELGSDGGVQKTRLSQLFNAEQNSLLIYGFMFGPNMDRPCPMCTSYLDSLNGAALHIGQSMSVAVCARRPIDEIAAFGESRGWSNLRLISSANNSYQRDYLAEGDDQSQWPMANVFVRRDEKVHHFWASELFFNPFEAGHTRHIDIMFPLWNVLDLIPEGRGENWFPALEYEP